VLAFIFWGEQRVLRTGEFDSSRARNRRRRPAGQTAIFFVGQSPMAVLSSLRVHHFFFDSCMAYPQKQMPYGIASPRV